MRSNFYVVAALLACVLILILDLITPVGYAEWLLYLIPLLLVYRAERTEATYVVLGVIGLFLIGGYVMVSGNRELPLVSVVNRLAGVFAFTVFTLVINKQIAMRRELSKLNAMAEQRSLELAEVNRGLETFSYSLSHDLRNPLHTVMMICDLLQRNYASQLDSVGQDCLRRLSKNAGIMSNLIDDILELSRVSYQAASRSPIDAGRLALDIIDDLRFANPEREIEIVIGDNLILYADTKLLRVALKNLIGNAWKYTGKTPNPRIEVGLTQRGTYKTLYVRDNGSGFNMYDADRLFQPFQRLHSEGDFSGTGIGLSIVDRAVKRHGGRVWAEASVGQGATFYLYFPEPSDFSETEDSKTLLSATHTSS